MGGAYGMIKSTKQERCLAPDAGTGPRDVKLQDCEDQAIQWKTDPVDGSLGTCSSRWATSSEGDQDASGIPLQRVCFHSTGHSLGTWKDDVVFGSLDTPTAAGRLTNHVIEEPTSAEDVAGCAAECSDAAGCHGFNFKADESMCELVKTTRAEAAAGDLVEADGWTFYEPEVITHGTNCVQACLPSTTTRLQFPQTGGKFGDSQLLPSEPALKFDDIVFPVPADTPDHPGSSTVHQECMAEADGITIEVSSYCEAAKTLSCSPDSSDPTKEKCQEAKEAHCRRMVLLPITYFGAEKADKREKCGHGPQQDTKVWHGARISVDGCQSIINFNDHCGSIQASI